MSDVLSAHMHEGQKGVWAWIDENFEKIFLIVGLLSIIFFISFQTFYRYVITGLFDSTGAAVWTEELSRFIFVWISYLALPIAIKTRSSIRVDIIYDKLSPRWQQVSWLVVDISFLILTYVILDGGIELILRQLENPTYSPVLGLPYLVPYAILPIGFGLKTIRLFQMMYKQVKICGFVDSLIAVAFVTAVCLPLVVSDYIEPIPVLFGYFILACAVGVPIAISLGLATLATIVCADTVPLLSIATTTFSSISESFPLMAITFFIAAGVFMGAGGLSGRLLAMADEMLGGLHGGMALATVVTCMFFGAISGSGPATVAAIGALTIPAMIDRGYDKLFAASLVAAAGAIGVMIPPSNPFVVYGVSAKVSIGNLFIGGIIPGVLIGLVLMTYAYFYSRARGWRGEDRPRSMGTIAKATWNAKWALMVPVIVLGGIYGGLMTPTEAAAVAALYGLVVGMFVYKEISFKGLLNCCVEACSTSSIIIVLMAMATIFGEVMMYEEVPDIIARAILELTENKFLILLLINILLIIVGTFMEALAAIVILTPILLPVVTSVGVSPLHFGIVMVVNLAIGFVTPPVGVNLFVASGVANAKLAQLSRAAMPMIGLMLAVLMLITYIPEISLFLVDLMESGKAVAK